MRHSSKEETYRLIAEVTHATGQEPPLNNAMEKLPSVTSTNNPSDSTDESENNHTDPMADSAACDSANRIPGVRAEDAASREVDVMLPALAALGTGIDPGTGFGANSGFRTGADSGIHIGADSGGVPARQRRCCVRFDCRRCERTPSGDCQKAKTHAEL